jgi:hypothetical protein
VESVYGYVVRIGEQLIAYLIDKFFTGHPATLFKAENLQHSIQSKPTPSIAGLGGIKAKKTYAPTPISL